MAQNITSVAGRNRLKAQREPYWARLCKGRYLGFRKSAQGPGTWIARLLDGETGKQRYQSLGELEHVLPSDRYDFAAREATAWFSQVDGGNRGKEVVTVRQACEAYVEHIRTLPEKGDDCANDAAKRFERYVYGDAQLANCQLSSLKESRLRSWRSKLTATPARIDRTKGNESPQTRARALSTVNRDMSPFRAALNWAYKNRYISSDHAWREALKPEKKVDGRRGLYLEPDLRSKLIAAAESPELAAFIRGISSLPLRVGAVAALRVDSFTPSTGELFISKDKAGQRRSIVLPDSTAKFFTKLAEGKKADDWLFSQADGAQWKRKDWGAAIKSTVRSVAELPESTVAYTLRHSGITDLIMQGLDLMTVASISGTSVEMLEKNYFHLLQARSKSALEVLSLPDTSA